MTLGMDIAAAREEKGKKQETRAATMEAPEAIDAWFKAHEDEFKPPICNRLMHKNQLTVMFVGGPNTREDFHLEQGAELFYMLRGNMELPTVQKGKRTLVKIAEGEVFLLPPRVPHSPQRPEQGSLGLVVERARVEGEVDALRFYKDFETCDERLWERYFVCKDLGKDLVPVVTEWKASEEAKTRACTPTSLPEERKIQEDEAVEVPAPFKLQEWLDTNAEALAEPGSALPLFPGHPDKETAATVYGQRGADQSEWLTAPAPSLETMLLQLAGEATVAVQTASEGPDAAAAAAVPAAEGAQEGGGATVTKRRKTERTVQLERHSVFVVAAGASYKIEQSAGAACVAISQQPQA